MVKPGDPLRRVLVTGYCLGGMASLELLRSFGDVGDAKVEERLMGIASVHGVLETKSLGFGTQQKGFLEPPRPGLAETNYSQIAGRSQGVRILIEHGEKDHLVPQLQIEKFMNEMHATGLGAADRLTFNAHQGASHGFAIAPRWGTSHNLEADVKSAWSMLTFYTKLFPDVASKVKMDFATTGRTPGGVFVG